MTELKGKSLNESDHAYAGYVEIRVYDCVSIFMNRFLISRAMVFIDWLCMSPWVWHSWWLYSVLMHDDVLKNINIVLIWLGCTWPG